MKSLGQLQVDIIWREMEGELGLGGNGIVTDATVESCEEECVFDSSSVCTKLCVTQMH